MEQYKISGNLWYFPSLFSFRCWAPKQRSRRKLFCQTFEMQWMVFILLAAVWLYTDLIYSHTLNVWIIRHWSSARALYVLLHFVGNADNRISAFHFVAYVAKEIFTCISHPTILKNLSVCTPGTSPTCFLNSIFEVRDWVPATVYPGKNVNILWVDVTKPF